MNRYYRKVKASSDRYEKAYNKLYNYYKYIYNLDKLSSDIEITYILSKYAQKYATREIRTLNSLKVKVSIALSYYANNI